MNRFNKLKIARQIGFAQFIVAALIAILIVIISITMFYNIVTESVHKNIQLSADTTVSKLERNYETVMEITEVIKEYIVQSIDVSKVNNQQYLDEYKDNIEPIIRTLAQESSIGNTAYFYFDPALTGQVNDIYYADQDLNGVVERQEEIPLSSYQNTESEDMAWWFQPIMTKSPYWTLPYIWEWDNGVKKEFVSYTQPVYVDGVLIGVVGGDMLYDRIYEIINEGFEEDYGYAYLLNDRYQLMIHPAYEENISLFTIDEGYYEFLYDNVDSGYQKVFEYSRMDKSLRLGAIRNLNNGWVLGLSVDYYEAYSILTDYIIGVFASLAVVMIIAIIISLRIGNRITKPLKEIAELVDEDEGSGMEIPVDLLERDDEVGFLVNKIIEYKKQIQDDYVEIVSKNDALTESLSKQYALEKELQIMVEVIGSSKEGIFIVNEQGETVFKNKSFDEAFGIDDSELRIFDDVLELEPYMMRQIEREKSFNSEKILKRFTGETYPAMLYITVVDVGQKFYLGIVQDVSETRAREKRIERLRFYDPLTSLMNKQRIQQLVNEGIESKYYEDGVGAMIIVNLDDFRIINEAMGYERSNIVLTKVANRLNEVIEKGDYLARITGDEFMIFTPNHQDIVEIQRKVDEVFKSFKMPLQIENEELFVSVSMGISLYPLDGSIFESLLTSASSALNHVKNSLKNAYAFYNTSINEATKESYELMTFLRKALDINAFSVVYQPQYDMVSGEMIGVEALLRLNYNNRPISPVTFIPLLEKGNLITAVGEFVINHSMMTAKELSDKGKGIPVSVNISGVQFKRPYLIDITKKLLERHQIDAALIKYEITEGVLLNDVDEAQKLIEELHELGIKVAIDDFGTGYSSLAYLKVFNIDCLKIDRAFIKEYPLKDDGHIARAIIGLAKSMNLSIIAEGVETEEQAKFLLDNSCVHAQGYLYSKPVKIEKIIELIENI